MTRRTSLQATLFDRYYEDRCWVTGILCLTMSLPVLPWVSGMLGLWADGSQASCVSLADIILACSCILSPRFLVISFEIEVSERRVGLPLQGSYLALYLLSVFLCCLCIPTFDFNFVSAALALRVKGILYPLLLGCSVASIGSHLYNGVHWFSAYLHGRSA